MSHTARPLDAHMISELPRRFRRGVTYVVSESRQSKPVAFVHLEKWGSELLIDMLVTHPQYRGMHYGSALMAKAESYGRSQQCLSARLYVDDINDRGLRFYTKLGYLTTGYIAGLRCYELIKPLVPRPQQLFRYEGTALSRRSDGFAAPFPHLPSAVSLMEFDFLRPWDSNEDS